MQHGTVISELTRRSGHIVLAHTLGVSVPRLAVWRRRGIPERRWNDMRALAGRIGRELTDEHRSVASAGQVIDALADTLASQRQLARLLGVDFSTLCHWHRDRHIPPRHWPPILRLAGQLGWRELSLADLEAGAALPVPA